MKTYRNGFVRALLISAATAAFSVGLNPAYAQTADAPVTADVPAADEAHASLDAIVVMAQRRQQNLQQVPLAVSAFSGDTLARSGVTSIRDVGQIDPSLNINASSGAVIPFLRGVGNPSSSTVGNESSVPVYIDDVYYTRLSPLDLELANVERVEVLKGPQGTLFGRNSSGGAIQVFTRDPGSSPEAEVQLGYANYDTISGRLYLAAPVTETIGASISVGALKQNDGWGRNLTTGEDIYRNKYINIRGKIVADLTEQTRISIIGFYGSQYSEQGISSSIYGGTTSGTPAFYGPPRPITAPGFYDTVSNLNGYVDHEGYGGSVKISHEAEFAELVSITAFRDAKEQYLTDGEPSPFRSLVYELNTIDKQFTQELQVKSKSNAAFDWIVGAFYLHSTAGYLPGRVTGDEIAAGGLQYLDIKGKQQVNSYSAYSQATFKVIPEGTNITLGLRYTVDKVHGIGSQDAVVTPDLIFPGQVPYDKEFTFKKLTYKVALDHRFTPDVMGYVSFSRGYKSGTFNTLPLIGDPTRPETIDAYELGLKSELFDRRLRFNMAVFQNDIANPQVQTVVQAGNANFVALTNGEKAKVRGAEFNVEALVTDGLTLLGGATFLDAKYVDFKNAPFYFPANGFPYGNSAPQVGDASGNTLAQVPKWRFNAGLNYRMDTQFGGILFDANTAYTDQFAWDADNILKQGDYFLVNSSLTFKLGADENLSVRVWGKNLTKTKYYTTELTLAGPAGYIAGPAAPRTYGVDVGYKF